MTNWLDHDVYRTAGQGVEMDWIDVARKHRGEWTPELVLLRLISAARVLDACVGRIGPASLFSPLVGPTVERKKTARQIIREIETMKTKDRPRRLPVTHKDVSMMEQAIHWPGKYLADKDGPLRILNSFIYAKAMRVPWSRVLRRKGVPYSTAKLARQRALLTLVDGLKSDGVEVL